MIDHAGNRLPLCTYDVRVGHARVTVEADSREAAVAQARRRFSEEMPRMWDVIHKLEDESFEVEEMQS